MPRSMTRRQFIKVGGMTLLVSSVGAPFAFDWFNRTPAAASTARHTLVIVQLSGGNDGLNTVIPYTSGAYYDARPHIGIKQSHVLNLTNELGLHPNMDALQKLYQQGNVAIVNGVGYPNPILSHFRSMAVWQSGDPTVKSQTGWLGRYLDATRSSSSDPLRALNIGNALPLSLVAQQSDVPCVSRPSGYRLASDKAKWNNDFLRAARAMYTASADPTLAFIRSQGHHLHQTIDEVQRYAAKLTSQTKFPETALGRQLETASQLLGAGAPLEVIYTQLGGFDDHAGEEMHHGNTLGDFSASVGAFFADLQRRGISDQATVLAFSEFGRRVKENGSQGTDHGEAGPVFLIGKRVKGGMYGEYPRLDKLHNGDLAYTVDFRSVYATAIQHVLGANPKDVLGGTYETVACF